MLLQYGDHKFEFVPADSDRLAGRIILDRTHKQLLRDLVEAESESWFLDSDGERLPANELFALSPWSVDGPNGGVKVLNRLLNLETGEAMFSTLETYGGESFRWVRNDRA